MKKATSKVRQKNTINLTGYIKTPVLLRRTLGEGKLYIKLFRLTIR